MLEEKYIKILKNNKATEGLLKLLYDKYKNDPEAMCYIRDIIIRDNDAHEAIFWAFNTKTFINEMAHIMIQANMYVSATAWAKHIGTQVNEMFQLIYDNYDLFYVYSWLKEMPDYQNNYLLKIKIIQNNDLENLILSRGRRRILYLSNASIHNDPIYKSFYADDKLAEEHKLGVIL